MAALTIPNAEIQEIFETTIIKWFDDSAKIWNRSALFDAVSAKKQCKGNTGNECVTA